MILYSSWEESDEGVAEGELMQIKRYADGQPVQKATETNFDKPSEASWTTMEITQSPLSAEMEKKAGKANNKKDPKAKNQPEQQKKKVKAKKTNKKAAVVEKALDYSLVSVLANTSSMLSFGQLCLFDAEKAKSNHDRLFSNGVLSVETVVWSSAGEEYCY